MWWCHGNALAALVGPHDADGRLGYKPGPLALAQAPTGLHRKPKADSSLFIRGVRDYSGSLDCSSASILRTRFSSSLCSLALTIRLTR